LADPNIHQSLAAMMAVYRYCVGFGVPAAILAIGVIGKKVARGRGWKEEDFYAGSELALAGVSGALVNLLEFLKPERTALGMLEKMLLGGNLLVVVVGLVGYWLTLSLKQDYATKLERASIRGRVLLLGFSNAIGLGVLLGALLMMIS